MHRQRQQSHPWQVPRAKHGRNASIWRKDRSLVSMLRRDCPSALCPWLPLSLILSECTDGAESQVFIKLLGRRIVAITSIWLDQAVCLCAYTLQACPHAHAHTHPSLATCKRMAWGSGQSAAAHLQAGDTGHSIDKSEGHVLSNLLGLHAHSMHPRLHLHQCRVMHPLLMQNLSILSVHHLQAASQMSGMTFVKL